MRSNGGMTDMADYVWTSVVTLLLLAYLTYVLLKPQRF
jgi:K+-transporting ATPase KdpF subunit